VNQREALEALAVLVTACEQAFAGPEMGDFDEDVSHPPSGITFGMIQRARMALTPVMTITPPRATL